MTPIAALENHARALNEALEDCRGYTADDFRRVCYARMCECLGIPLRDQGLVLKLSKRRGIGEVRRLVHAAGERINLPTTTLTTFMETLDYLAELEEAGIR
jgi:hypothetical protein